jgi:hypothetical protein
LSAIERGVRALRRQDLEAIAAACELPYEFFTVDLARSELGDAQPEVPHMTPVSEGRHRRPARQPGDRHGPSERRLAAIEGELAGCATRPGVSNRH